MQEKSKSWLQFLLEVIVLVLLFTLVQYALSAGLVNQSYQITLTSMCINVILAVSLNLINGFTGQLSLGHAGFMAIGLMYRLLLPTLWICPLLQAYWGLSGCRYSRICGGAHFEVKRRLSGYCYPILGEII